MDHGHKKNDLNMREISAIFFDLDNTLVQTRKADELTCKEIAIFLKEEWRLPEKLAKMCTDNFLHNFRRCPDHPDIDLDQWRKLLWISALGADHEHLADDIYTLWKRLRYDFMAFDPQVIEMLRHLRVNYSVALITNGPSRSQWEKIIQLNASHLFDLILVSGDLPCEKPQAEIFHLACQELNVSPEKSIMVGDRLETDILGGKLAGLAATVWIPFNSNAVQQDSHHQQPDVTIYNILELATMLQISS